MDKIEIAINGNIIFTLDEIEVKTIKEAEKISEENFSQCVKDWGTMIFSHRLRLATEKLIKEYTYPYDGRSSLLEKKGYSQIPSNKKELLKLIIPLLSMTP